MPRKESDPELESFTPSSKTPDFQTNAEITSTKWFWGLAGRQVGEMPSKTKGLIPNGWIIPVPGHLLILVLMASVLPTSASAAANFYVAVNGNDAWSGRRAAPNRGKTDGPFATLEKAREAVRQLKGRDAMAVDSLDSCGVYFGTTGGQVYASANAGDTWPPIVRYLPPVLSVEVQTLP
jgi:hypothetical protein